MTVLFLIMSAYNYSDKGGIIMQAEHSRGNGFIISPLSVPRTIQKPEITSCKPVKLKAPSRVKEHISYLTEAALNSSVFFTKRVLTAALSASVAICCIMGLCNFFTIGTAVYCNDKIVAFAAADKDYYSALSAARSYAEEKSSTKIGSEFTIVPAITLRSQISTSTALRDKLLLSSSAFSQACTLYSGNNAIFNAQSEEIAKEVVEEYVSEYSMNGKADVASTLTYKNSILPTEHILDKEECLNLLSQSGEVPVISIVSNLVQKEIPFETQTQKDDNMYIGESVTVSEGKVGSASVKSETVYKNGAEQSSRILSENVIAKPIARVVRVGTKPKDVLQSGLFEPLKGVLSSDFGKRWGKNHEGIDIAVPVGTPVMSAECGTVTFAGDGGTYGKLVRIDHGHGVITAYAHLSEINVSTGQSVGANTQIALSGNTGRSTGPHLHFEVVKNDTPLDPKPYFKK